MTEELSIGYFRNLLRKNQTELKSFCDDWKKYSNDPDVPEMVSDEIRTTIGLTNLLLQQKLKQFAGLIDDSEFKRGEKEISCFDLQGFWDMVYNEVEKIQKRFQNLKNCQQNGWIFVEESIVKKELKKKPAVANTLKVATDAKARALAARQRLAEAKLKMKAQILMKKSENSAETQKNIRNLDISEQQDALSVKSEIPPKKLALTEMNRCLNKKQKSLKKEKENIVINKEECTMPKTQKSSDEILATVNLQNRKGSKKEVIPLQCVTRSAKRPMLAQHNTLKN